MHLIRKHRDALAKGGRLGLKGRVAWEVLTESGFVIRSSQGERSNLILNQGLDQLASYSLSQVSTYCAVGTGNADPIDSQVGLVNEVARTNNYKTGTGDCGSFWTSPTVCEFKRTYDFPIGALNGTYYEIGFSPIGTTGDNLFSRTLLKDGGGNPTGVTVGSSQQLRVIYTLSVSLEPATATAGVVDISGVGELGMTHAIQDTRGIGGRDLVMNAALRGIGPNGGVESEGYNISSILVCAPGGGSVSPITAQSQLEPARWFGGVSSVYASVSDATDPLASPGTSVPRCGSNRSFKTTTTEVYTPGSYYSDITLHLSVNEGNLGIRSICVGLPSSIKAGTQYQLVHSYACLMDSAITKADTHTLDLVFRLSWGRA
jgi:hypothetical protein